MAYCLLDLSILLAGVIRLPLYTADKLMRNTP